MKTNVVAVSTGIQKFEFTAETPAEVAGLKAFERLLKGGHSAQVFFQEPENVLNVSFSISKEEYDRWQAAATQKHLV